MHTPRKLLAAFVAACFFTVAAFAADASPAGTWKWMQQGFQGGEGFERKITLEVKEGKVTGKMHAGQSQMGELPEVAIKDGTFKDGVVAFSITRDIQGNSFTVVAKPYDASMLGNAIAELLQRHGQLSQSA